jgi:Zn finger protein HypA/HybF involved in hydrogenase expression
MVTGNKEEIMNTKKIKVISMVFALALCLLMWQSCKVTKAVYETIQHALFAESGHADETAEAFRHWDEDDPPLVPTSCAKCHALGGFQDFAADGVVDAAATPAEFDCDLCHTGPEGGPLRTFASVTFPSGAVIENLGVEATCMQCHQGRASTATVDNGIANAGVGDDTPSTRLRFSNIHYFAAAATMYGTLVKGGYQYAGKSYDAKFAHVDGYGECIDCHNPHSLEVMTERCDTCHPYVKGAAQLHDIRWYGSLIDYDGDGNITEGIYYEVEGMKAKLYSAILAYAQQVVGVPIVYDAHSYPYFFNDANNNGIVDANEGSYASFTPRLLRACYNYQVVQKDPGGFAHGGKYLLELMYDSVEDLNSRIGGFSMAGLHRGDEGHFDGSSEAWRHWDGDGEVSSGCARCHSATGLAEFLETGENAEAAHLSNGMLCTTCHTSPPAVRRADSIEFPSGEMADLGDTSNICMACHQGRASKSDVDSKIAGSAGNYSFTNIHYFPAAAVFFGFDVHGGYEYAGKSYAGRQPYPNHLGKFDTCVKCHMGTMGTRSHNVAHPPKANCVGCHGQDISQPYPGGDPAMFSFEHIRPGTIPDYDGDGNISESLKDEIQGLEAALYAQMQAYGLAIGKPILHDTHSYPYFFKDTNGNGLIDPGEATRSNGYRFDAAMLKAAYNYQMSLKEPHGFIHNARYVAQLLVDSIGDLGGNVAPYTWR